MIQWEPENPTPKDRQASASPDRFLNPKYNDVKPQNEIRSAAFCFANLEAVVQEARESTIARLQHLAVNMVVL
jgi:hypothetical protein